MFRVITLKSKVVMYFCLHVNYEKIKNKADRPPKINVSIELEMTSDARQNGRKDLYVKHSKCVCVILKRSSLLIGPNDVERYGVT